MKHHDQRQLRGKEFIWACSFSGRIHHGRRGLAEHGQSRKMKDQLFNYVGKSGRATRKLSDAVYAQSLSQGRSSFSEVPHPKSSIVSPKHHQQLRTKPSNTWACVGHLIQTATEPTVSHTWEKWERPHWRVMDAHCGSHIVVKERRICDQEDLGTSKRGNAST